MLLLLFSLEAFVAASLSDSPQRYCGAKLKYMLSLYCRDVYENSIDKSWFEMEGKLQVILYKTFFHSLILLTVFMCTVILNIRIYYK